MKIIPAVVMTPLLCAMLAAPAAGSTREEEPSEADTALTRANAQVDLAEHSLALARRPAGLPPDPLRLGATRMTRADVARVEFYKQGTLAARQTLMEVLQQQRQAAARQTYTASNEWTPEYAAAAASPIARP